MKKHTILIHPDGSLRAVHDDRVGGALAALGSAEIRRASHVESTAELLTSYPETWEWLIQEHMREYGETRDAAERSLRVFPRTAWWASLLPVGGPVLGPFPFRQQALLAEMSWLQNNSLGL